MDRSATLSGWAFDEPNLFDETELYRQVNSDAHKEIPARVACPALTWHMAFLIPRKSPIDHIDNRDRFKSVLDRILVRLIHGLRSQGLTETIEPTVGGGYVLFRRCVDDELRRVRKIDCTPRQVAVLEADQRLIELEFKWALATIVVRVHFQVNLFTITALARLCERHVAAGSEPARRGACVEQFDEELTLGFWMKFTQFLFSLPRVANMFRHEIFAQVFTDLRGVVVSDESLDLPATSCLPDGKLDVWATNLVQHISPQVNFADRFECSASYMLGRRAVFMTALGPQPANLPPSKRLPTTFLLLLSRESGVGVKQLGRLVDRINASETMRLAALLDLGLLRAAGDNLSLVDTAIQRARRAVDDFERKDSRGRRVALAEMRAAVADAQCVVDEIASDFLDSTMNAAQAGLTFRIESARYYVSQFRKGMASMRLGRVEGFQRYDFFVERRLGPTFEYIDRLGARYDRGLQAMRSINQRYLSTTIAAMNELSTTTGISVEKIQRDGAAIVIGALLPYYFMGAFHYFTEFSYLGKAFFFFIVLALWIMAMHQFDFVHQKREETGGSWHFEIRVACIMAVVLLLISMIPSKARLEGVAGMAPPYGIDSQETRGHEHPRDQTK